MKFVFPIGESSKMGEFWNPGDNFPTWSGVGSGLWLAQFYQNFPKAEEFGIGSGKSVPSSPA